MNEKGFFPHYLEGTPRFSIPGSIRYPFNIRLVLLTEVDHFDILCNQFAYISSISVRAEWLLIAVKKRKNFSRKIRYPLSFFQWHSYAAAPAVFPGTAVDKHRVTKVLPGANVCKTALFITTTIPHFLSYLFLPTTL